MSRPVTSACRTDRIRAASIRPPGVRRKDKAAVVVRVIEYELEDVSGAGHFYRLITTILDPDMVPVAELAAPYHEHREIETALDEILAERVVSSRRNRPLHRIGIDQCIKVFK